MGGESIARRDRLDEKIKNTRGPDLRDGGGEDKSGPRYQHLQGAKSLHTPLFFDGQYLPMGR